MVFRLVSNWPGIGVKAAAQISTEKGVGEDGDTVAVTVLIPRFSGIEDSLRISVTTGSTGRLARLRP